MDINCQSGFYLGEWWVSPPEGRITRGAEVVRLEPKVMEVLVYLASRPGDVVTRAELERDVWRGAMVGYDAVTGTVIKLRKALEDDARNPRLIATIPKRGYELIAPVTLAQGGRPEGPIAASPDVPTVGVPIRKTSKPRRLAGLRLIALAAVVMVAAGIWLVVATAPPDAPPSQPQPVAERPSIAVLPFESLSDDPRQEYLADGMTEDLITDLSRSSSLMVIGSNSSFTYKGQHVSPDEVAKHLGVMFVLQGSIRPVGKTIRINAQLVDARTGFNRWAARYDRNVDEIFAIQDEIASGIVEALDVRLTRQERQRLAQRATSSLQAYDLFQEGQAIAKTQTKEALERAGEAYREAIRADPTYGRAYGALGYVLATAFRRGWTDAPVETSDRALELAKDGVALDDSIPQTHWALGYVHLFRKEYEQAERAAAESIEIAPNYADGYGLLALISNNLGKPQRAVELIETGMRLNPYYTWDYPFNLGWAYYTLGSYEQAVEQLENAHERNPNAVPVKVFLAASYVRAGRQEDAEWLAGEIQTMSGTETISHTDKTIPMANPKYKKQLLEDLRKAGLPD